MLDRPSTDVLVWNLPLSPVDPNHALWYLLKSDTPPKQHLAVILSRPQQLQQKIHGVEDIHFHGVGY